MYKQYLDKTRVQSVFWGRDAVWEGRGLVTSRQHTNLRLIFVTSRIS